MPIVSCTIVNVAKYIFFYYIFVIDEILEKKKALILELLEILDVVSPGNNNIV